MLGKKHRVSETITIIHFTFVLDARAAAPAASPASSTEGPKMACIHATLVHVLSTDNGSNPPTKQQLGPKGRIFDAYFYFFFVTGAAILRASDSNKCSLLLYAAQTKKHETQVDLSESAL